MFGEERVVAVIPAFSRGNFVQHRNVRLLEDHPLLAWSIAAAAQSPVIDRVIVVTEDLVTATVARTYGAEVESQPPDFSTETGLLVKALSTLRDRLILSGEESRVVVVLDPATPFRSENAVADSLSMVIDQYFDSAATFHEAAKPPGRTWTIAERRLIDPVPSASGPWAKPAPRGPAFLELTGEVFALDWTLLREETPSLLVGSCAPVLRTAPGGPRIETDADFELARITARSSGFPKSCGAYLDKLVASQKLAKSLEAVATRLPIWPGNYAPRTLGPAANDPAEPHKPQVPIRGPSVITESGDYYLAEDIRYGKPRGAALVIEASNVRVDLNGRTIRGTCDPRGSIAKGILCIADYGVVVFGGSVTGFWTGIDGTQTDFLTVEEVDLSANNYIGLSMGGHRCQALYNVVESIRGYDVKPYAMGINLNAGTQCIARGNLIRDIHRQPGSDPQHVGEGVGINIGSSSRYTTVCGNWLENDSPTPDTIGVFAGTDGGRHFVRGNTIVNFALGVQGGGSTGSQLECEKNHLWLQRDCPGSTGISIAYGRLTGNLLIGFEKPINSNIPSRGNSLARSTPIAGIY